MNPVASLFNQRRNQSWTKGARYATLIAKGLHFLPVVILILIYFGYRAFLLGLPEEFPVYLLMTLLLTWTLSQTRIRTYVKPADPVFLLPADKGLREYFRRSLVYSGIIQSLKVLFLMAFLFPLFYSRVGNERDFLLALAILIPLKIWNVGVHWLELREPDRRGVQLVLRWVTNGLLTLWLFAGQLFGWPLLVAFVWFTWLTLYHRRLKSKVQILPWEELLLREQRTVSSWYRLASQFVDVPHIANEIKPRPLFAPFLRRVPTTPENTYLYLYLRTFFRYREPFGVYIRLTLVTTLLFAFLRGEWWLSALILSLGLFLTGIQLPWIRRIHRFQPWFRLYPRPEEEKRTGWARLAFGLLAGQATLVVTLQWWLWKDPFPLLPLFLLIGWSIAWILGRIWLPKRLPKRLHKQSSLL